MAMKKFIFKKKKIIKIETFNSATLKVIHITPITDFGPKTLEQQQSILLNTLLF